MQARTCRRSNVRPQPGKAVVALAMQSRAQYTAGNINANSKPHIASPYRPSTSPSKLTYT